MRGEHCWACSPAWSTAGSSPHARGALRHGGQGLDARGIIPACAGSTRGSSPELADCRDHPRMRGEHKSASTLLKPTPGSSPHARGAHGVAVVPALQGGDHPRMRGEHSMRACPAPFSTGSSPHARGALLHECSRPSRTGIIPACAGSTCCGSSSRVSGGDHPRMRGEHPSTKYPSLTMPGSSPHARGAHTVVHADGVNAGSSPHARGALYECCDVIQATGIIPACAGSTTTDDVLVGYDWDHPRMRGEHNLTGAVSGSAKGSSPHARGAQAGRRDAQDVHGIIPACAGSTLKNPSSRYHTV